MTKEMEIDQHPQEKSALTFGDIKANLALVEKSVLLLEKRFALRALRTLPALRKRLDSQILISCIENLLSSESAFKEKLLTCLGKNDGSEDLSNNVTGMEIDSVSLKKSTLPESELYIAILVLVHLLDTKNITKGFDLAVQTVHYIQVLNRRTLDPLAASIFFYFSYFYECQGKLSECLPTLLAAQKTASLRRDDESEAVLINLLLRNYINYNLYDQADKLSARVTFPESAGNNQFARFLFYSGRIMAIQLDYTSAYKNLMQAIRKAPQNTAAGFKQSVNKFAIIVQLLMGEIPERSVFRQPELQRALVPYFHIAQSVRIGDLSKFQEALNRYGEQFKKDKTFTLILRLRHNVIKAGIRMISLAYSRISLKDICLKLHLDCEEDAEYIVAKAIRDGVIDAVVAHEQGYMKSKENVDIYSSDEPQTALDQRISFCLNIHNECVKAMRFPLSKKKLFEQVEEARDIEKEISNLVDELEEDDM